MYPQGHRHGHLCGYSSPFTTIRHYVGGERGDHINAFTIASVVPACFLKMQPDTGCRTNMGTRYYC